MKISHIIISSVLGVTHAEIAIDTPCVLFAGKNGAGKTSIATAVRMALTREVERASLKREIKQLVKDGAKSGTITVQTDQGAAVLELPSGDPSGDWAPVRPDIVKAVCDAQRVVTMTDDERRKFFFRLSGTRVDAVAVAERLIQKGCDPARVKEIEGSLPGGFENSSKRAATLASEARGAWKAIAGEVYGEKKAATWECVAPSLTEDEAAIAHSLKDDLASLDRSLSDAQERLGAAKAAADAAATYETRIGEARTKAATYSGHESLRVNAAKEVATWEAQVASLNPVQLKPNQETHACPECSAIVEYKDGTLIPYVKPDADAEHDPKAFQEAQRALELCKNVMKRHSGNVKIANDAAILLKDMEEHPPKAPDVGPDAIQVTIDELRGDIKTKKSKLDELEAKNAAAEQAVTKTKAALKHHETVVSWAKIADALSPDGIQAEILAECLKPINRRLAQTSLTTDWPQIVIGSDMSITMGGRPYRLVVGTGGSEEFRAQAMIAEAVSFLSGIKFFMLDNVDHCLPEHRIAMIKWLHALATAGDVERCLLFMAAKDKPSGLPATFKVLWIEDGKVS